MSDMPWVRFFPSDWLGGTRGMSAAETGIYITLVSTMYERGEPVPEDHPRLARLCGASNSTFKTALETLVAEGKILRLEEGLWNERVEKESVYRSEKSEVGKQAAIARWGTKGNKNNVHGHANAMQSQSVGNANQKPEAIKKEKVLTAHSRPEPERDFFAEFWLSYPRRDGDNPKKPARLAFERLLSKGADPDRLIAAAQALALKHPSPTPFVPQAQTWLRQERFADAEPIISGEAFCASDEPNTRWHVIRYRDEHDGHDPPSAEIGGKAGYMIPASWVKAMQLRQASGN